LGGTERKEKLAQQAKIKKDVYTIDLHFISTSHLSATKSMPWSKRGEEVLLKGFEIQKNKKI
jgi:hypothetical protein